MRGLLLITLVALSTKLIIAVPDCSSLHDGDLIGDPADCNSYYECVGDTPIHMKCPPGLEWSEKNKQCDFPNLAECKETETTERPTSTSVSPTVSSTAGSSTARPTKCPDEDDPNNDVLLPNPEDCGSFFKCLNGVPHLIPCPQGQEWSIELNRCDYPEIAKCEETVSKPNTVSSVEPSDFPTALPSSTVRPTKCPEEDDPNNDVLLPNPADCGSFFKCLNGVPHLIPCPQGQEWSIELSRCDFPEIAKCKESAFFKKLFIQLNIRKDDRCPAEDGPEDVLLPNPDDCTTFFKCNNGGLILQDCPAGLHWNDEAKYCDYPAIAGCEKIKNRLVRHTWPTECPAENGEYDFFLPNLEDCSTYYRCDHGRKILMDCPVGTLWDADFQRCDHEAIAKCATE